MFFGSNAYLPAINVHPSQGISSLIFTTRTRDPLLNGSGLILLVTSVLFGSKIYLVLSAGGIERMIAYPLIIRAIGTGAYLMAPGEKKGFEITSF